MDSYNYSRLKNVGGGQSRDSLVGRGNREWIGPNEKLVLEYIYTHGLKTLKPSFLRELGIDMKRRIYDVLNRLTSRGVLRKKAKGLYDVVEEALVKFIDYPVRRLKESVKGSQGTSHLRGVGGGRDRVWYIEPRRYMRRARGVGVRSTFDPVFLDHVVGYRSMDFVYGEEGRLKWRDLVFFDRVLSAEIGAYIDVQNWSGVMKVYWPVGEARAVVEWQHPRGFLKEHSLLELRRAFWERVVDVVIALTRLVLSYGPWWIVKRLVRELRHLDICRGVVYG